MDLKAYFHEPYQGGESFINNVILPIFGEDKYDDAYEEDVIDNNPELERMAESTGISQILRLGTIDIPMNPTDVFDITVNNRVQMERNRVAIQMLIRRIMSTYSSAFMVFHYNDSNKWDWRFSFCSKQGNNSEATDSKRYTFLLGPNQSCRTAAENFNKLAEKAGKIELDDIVKAFDVEVLSKEFFDKYKLHYECFCEYVYANKDNTEYFGREFSECEDKIIRDYVKKLLGRIVFLHFLQKKGWMGVPANKKWGEGDLNFMRNLFNNASQSQKENFLDKVLKPLFEKGLDTDRTANNDLFNTGVEGFKNVKIPYLNGGLFEKDALDKPKARFSAQLFDDLLEFFYEYNFTIDENDPNDAQVGVDPEMLGRIFENLLEDNKDKGAFYTPKEIVQYMCKESLIAYLQTDVKTEKTKEAIRTFVTTYDVNAIGGKDSATAKDIDEYLKDVKICDPAIGSGAFPMGMLKELFFCRGAIENFDDAAEIKRHIIQQNIYGVDIEKGAVDIARLRFWLALIVDEKTPHALPNMDFKIMQGNSLLEQYKGVDLSRIMENKTVSFGAMQIPFLENDIDESRRQLIALRKEYFHTYDKERKKTLRKAMREKVQQLIDLTTNNLGGTYNGKHSETIDLSGIDIASTPEFFLWHTWFHDIFSRPLKEGFDIVIGNPPYIKELGNEKIFAPLKSSTFGKQYHVGKMDYWYYFLHKSIELTHQNSIISFITSRYWINSLGAKKIIKHVSEETNFLSIVDIGKLKVFDNVVGYHMISILTKNKKQEQCQYYAISDDVNNIEKKIFTNKRTIHRKDLFSNNEIVLEKRITPNTLQILDDICNVSQGIVEASDKISPKMYRKNPLPNHYVGEGIFVLSLDEYRKLNLSSEEDSIMELFEDEGCLLRYCINYEKTRKLIYADTTNRNKIAKGTQFSNIKKHLDNMSDYITSSYKPYGLHRARKYCDFTQPKLIGPSMFSQPCYAYDDKNLFVGMSYIIITPKENTNLFFVLGILNSQYAQDWFYSNAKHRGSGVDVGVEKLRTFPIPIATIDQQNQIVEFVKVILDKKKHNSQADTSSLEHEIDLLVYDLYGLTQEEIAIVEGTNNE